MPDLLCMTGNPELIASIRHEIRERGPIPFARFMELALYHPLHGYYTSGRARIGKAGDYFTSPTVGPLFGRFLGMQVAEMWEQMGKPIPFTLLEIGSNRGWLAQDVTSWARERRPDFAEAVQCWTCERGRVEGSGLRGERPDKAFQDWREVQSGSVVGCVFSNELVDAFPVHRIRRESGEWKEIYVAAAGDRFELQTGRLCFPLPSALPQLAALAFPDGYTTEVNVAALDWMKEMARILRSGFLVTIDYGYSAEEYYAPHRTDGTLLCYHQHRANNEPLERVGEQDITAHVDFGSLVRRGTEVGVALAGFTDQTHFIMGIGQAEIERIVSANPGRLDKTRQQLQTLLHPADMGRVFKVLIQHKGVRAGDESACRSVRLLGLKYARGV